VAAAAAPRAGAAGATDKVSPLSATAKTSAAIAARLVISSHAEYARRSKEMLPEDAMSVISHVCIDESSAATGDTNRRRRSVTGNTYMGCGVF
jgi:hypothetical protein